MDARLRSQRIAAVAAFVVSAALFLTALLGIASIDPGGADAAAPAPTPTRSVLVELPDAGRDGDCPWREQQRQHRREHGVSS